MPLNWSAEPLGEGVFEVTAETDGYHVAVRVEADTATRLEIAASGPRGLTADHLRGIDLGGALRAARRRAAPPKPAGADWPVVDRGTLSRVQLTAEEKVARMAADYASWVSQSGTLGVNGDLGVNEWLAELHGLKPSQVRDLIHRARTCGLLSDTHAGRPGGDLNAERYMEIMGPLLDGGPMRGVPIETLDSEAKP